MKPLNVGIIGCGNISETYLSLAPLFRSLNLTAVADIDSGASQARAGEFNVRADSVDELLAASDIDIIVNLTIPAAHFELTKRILKAGKHAYSEKPLVLTLEEGKQLRDLAAARQLRIGSAPDTFLGGSHQRARRAIDEGQVGTIIGGSCHFMSQGMESWHPNPDFFFQPGAGPILDLGPYYITNLVQFLGPVRAVSAMAAASFPTRTIGSGEREGETIPVDTPTNIHALVEFVSGSIVTVGASWDVRAHRHGTMELYGTEGTLFVPDPNFFGGDVELAKNGDECETLSLGNHPFAVPNKMDNAEIERANYRCAGLADMAAGIVDGRAHRCNVDISLHAIDVMTGILTSAESREWVTMSTSCERPEALSAEQAAALLI